MVLLIRPGNNEQIQMAKNKQYGLYGQKYLVGGCLFCKLKNMKVISVYPPSISQLQDGN